MAENRDSMSAVVPISSGMPAVKAQLSRLAIDAAETAFGERLTAPSWAIQEAKNTLPSIDRALNGASHDNRVTILERLADHTATPDALKSSDTARIAAFWGAFHADLAHIPAAVLSRACAAWRRSGERFYPTSGQLLKLCRDDEQWREALKLRRGLSRLTGATPAGGDNFTAADASEAEAKLAAYLAGLNSRVQGETVEVGPSDYANPVRPWQRPGWKPKGATP